MSTKENDVWLEAAFENFEGAIAQGNYPLAKDIIADVFDVSPDSARYFTDLLRAIPVSQFTNPRDVQTWM